LDLFLFPLSYALNKSVTKGLTKNNTSWHETLT